MSNNNSLLFGWFYNCLYEEDDGYLEPEGIVLFYDTPTIGQKFMLPSSNYKEEWVVKRVYNHDMSFTAVKSSKTIS